jgi:hypothetical protein|nr:MAG TPA: hypothetical protein [Caudoviricetes sp.]
MAYNKEAQRLFKQHNLKLPKLIKDYRGVLYYDDISRMLDPMPDSEDKKQLVRVLNCNDVGSVKADKYGNPRYIIPIEYFAKDGVVNEKFVLGLTKGVFKKYNGWSGKYLVTTASSRYELLTKVIMVLGRD